MKKIVYSLIVMFLFSCNNGTNNHDPKTPSGENSKAEVGATLDKWHKAAAGADFDTYFSYMAKDAVYIGTDAGENWKGDEFKKFAEPYFKRGKAWDFKNLNRNVYFSENGKTAWFNELLQTHMGICRGSGVMVRENNAWKIKQYVLSMTVPNDHMEEVAYMKRDFDASFVKRQPSGKK